ncbi:Alpha/Beta hydrolase protein [Syncephalastrum racemosum]|uniref:Alpha/Beta hydrolase protein n=1 Tax=Syncephalastrum racemosum TaxID=13706 RepID=A0A1X2HNT0_SYNRA|nr:Alpha/Beta hydrolase protein [Syncephalastrum racemosum]
MPRLVPAQSFLIPVHSATKGHNVHRLAVERHVFPAPRLSKRKYAFLWSHSTGFNKESMHPAMRAFVQYLRRDPRFDDTDVDLVAWDARNHGDSARVNAGALHPDFGWFDNAMDTFQVTQHLELRKNHDTLFGVGHSLGATSMLLCEQFFPKTFDGLSLIEPVMRKELAPWPVREKYPEMASKKRRDTWPSREECFKQFSQRSFWKRFDPEVLQLYVDYGMVETDEGSLTLKTPKTEEFQIYDHQAYATISAYASLRSLSIPLHLIYARESELSALRAKDKESIMNQNAQISFELVEGSHMVLNEAPKELAPSIASILQRDLFTSTNSGL